MTTPHGSHDTEGGAPAAPSGPAVLADAKIVLTTDDPAALASPASSRAPGAGATTRNGGTEQPANGPGADGPAGGTGRGGTTAFLSTAVGVLAGHEPGAGPPVFGRAASARGAGPDGLASPAQSDGRRMRRERNRQAVVDALLALFREGDLRPSSSDVANRANLSPRSLFRYFDDLDDLIRTAVAVQMEQARPLMSIAAVPGDPLQRRIDALVVQRAALFDAIGPAAAVARREAPFQPLLREQVGRTRTALRGQLQALFAPELDALDDEQAATVLAAIDVACSFEAYQLLRADQGLAVAAVRAVMAMSVRSLMETASRPA